MGKISCDVIDCDSSRRYRKDDLVEVVCIDCNSRIGWFMFEAIKRGTVPSHCCRCLQKRHLEQGQM